MLLSSSTIVYRKKIIDVLQITMIAILCNSVTIAKAEQPTTAVDQITSGISKSVLPTIKVIADHTDTPKIYAGGQISRDGQIGILGTKDYMDSPFSQVNYTSDTIRHQQALSVAEALTTADSSVRASIGSANRYDALTIRGFRIENSDIALNGLYGLAPGYRVGVDPVERIELIRGASAFLYGISPSGGIGGNVNVVTKRADKQRLAQVTTEYTSDQHFGIHADIGQRFGENQAFGLRLNTAYRDGDTSIEHQNSRNSSHSLGLDYQTDRLNLSADIIYQKDMMSQPMRGYTPIAGIKVPKAPDPTINLSPAFDYSDADSLTFLSRAEYQLSDNVMVYGTVGHNRFEYEKQEAPGPTILNSDGDARSTSNLQHGHNGTISAEFGTRTTLSTGPVQHQLVLAANTFRQQGWFGQTKYGDYLTNIYHPVYPVSSGQPISITPETKSSERSLKSLSFADTLSTKSGLLQLTLGVRHQQVESSNFSTTGAKTDHYDESATTPSFAFVFKPLEHISFYANYIEALTTGATPPADAANFNQVFAPYKSKQYEIGSKFDLGSFGGTLGLFQIRMPMGIIDPETKNYSLDGEQQNRGIELNGFGNITPGVHFLGGITYLDAKLRRTQNGTYDGNHAIGAPQFLANLGLEWDTPFVPQLTLTGRMIHNTKAYISADNSQSVPDWTRFDLGARYRTKIGQTPVTFQANLNNAFNQYYWEANPSSYVISGMPRTVLLSTSFDF